jgi:hypothetical protein
VLSILFGVGPTLVPGGTLSLVAGKIRSRAGLSSAASSKPFAVLAPLVSTRPGPISLKGSAEIDSCSDFQVNFTSRMLLDSKILLSRYLSHLLSTHVN